LRKITLPASHLGVARKDLTTTEIAEFKIGEHAEPYGERKEYMFLGWLRLVGFKPH
jgi:hypothetical protein